MCWGACFPHKRTGVSRGVASGTWNPAPAQCRSNAITRVFACSSTALPCRSLVLSIAPRLEHFRWAAGRLFQLEHGHLLLSRDRLDLLVGQDLALVLREDIVTNQRRQLRRGLCVCFCTAHILTGLRRKAAMLCGVGFADGVTSGSSNWHDVASVSRSRPRGADARLRCLCELRVCL